MAREKRQHDVYSPLARPVAGGLEMIKDIVLKESGGVTY